MQNITENLTSLISQITAILNCQKVLEKENEKLKEENEKLLKGFDTDTHILVEKEKLSDLADKMDIMISDADSASNNCETAEEEIRNAKYYADECSGGAYDLKDKLEKLLKPKEKGENNEK